MTNIDHLIKKGFNNLMLSEIELIGKWQSEQLDKKKRELDRIHALIHDEHHLFIDNGETNEHNT